MIDVVEDAIEDTIDDTRLEELYRIGVDEVSYRKGHRYLTVVADHDRDGAVVWVAEGKDHSVLEAFYDELGEERTQKLETVTLDMGGANEKATNAKAPHVIQCMDPFHYRLKHKSDAAYHLDWWLAWACRSPIPAFVTLSKTVRANRERILPAVDLGLSNSRLEGLNSKIRLIDHCGYGHHTAASLIAMIYLCCGGITIELPKAKI